MAKKTPEQKLADAVNLIGIEKAEGYIRFLKALNAPKKLKSTGGKGTGTLAATSGSS